MSEFEKRLHQEFLRSKRYNRPLSALMIKIQREEEIRDDLKEEVSLFLSNLCSATLRETDVLSVQDQLSPLTVLLLETDSGQALQVQKRIEQKLNLYHHKPYKDDGFLAVSFGIASFTADMKTPNDLLDAARHAL